MKSIFLDTNFFIQCQIPKDINWEALFDQNDHIQLLIPRAVQIEIDRLKNDGNSRRSKKARSANSLLKETILANENRIDIHEKEPFIEITFPPPIESHPELPIFLDKNKIDDQIIAEILSFKNQHSNNEVYLLTHDTNLLLTAKRCGINYLVIPNNWLLSPEPDSKDKKIAELEKHLSDLRKSIPEIKFTIQDDSGNEISKKYLFLLPEYKEPDDVEIEKLISKFKNQYPIKVDFTDNVSSSATEIFRQSLIAQSILSSQNYFPLSEEEITKYRTEQYPNWIINLKQHISLLLSFFNKKSRTFSVTFLLFNSGQVFAENVLVEFRAYGGILFLRQKEEDEEIETHLATSFPQPPSPPKGSWRTSGYQSIIDSINASKSLKKDKFFSQNNYISSAISSNLVNFQKDKNVFSQKTLKYGNPTDSIIFECEEFRHKRKPERFVFNVFVPPTIEHTQHFAIEAIFSAKNIPEPVKHIIQINFTIAENDSRQEAYNFLQSNKYLI